MKEKILSALKTKYSNLGFGEKAFSGVADYLVQSIAEESQIETAITGVENLLKAFQGDIDRVRTEKTDLQRQYDELKSKQEAGGTPTKKDEPKPDDLKAMIANAIAEAISPLQTKLQTYEQKEVATARQTLIAEKAKGLEIPDYLLKRISIPNELDEAGVTQYLTEFKQELVNNSLPTQSPFPQTNGEITEDQAKSIVDKMAI